MSWKKSGGIDTYERSTNIKAKSIVTDNIVVKDAFLSDFIVEGTMTVKNNTFLQKELDVSSNAIIRNNLDIYEDLHLGNRLYLTDNDTFIKGNNKKVGINKTNPTSTLDIVGNIANSINVYSNTIQNRNILARNNIDNGIAFFVDSNNVSTMQFYNKDLDKDLSGVILQNGVTSDITNVLSDAKIEYSNSEKKITIKGSQMENMEIISKLLISNNDINHNFQESLAIYDSESIDLYPSVNSYSGSKYGNSLSMYGNSSNNITFLNMITNNKGLCIGGGNYPIDTNKSMGILDLHGDSTSIPAQIMINGSNNYDKIIGFNTYEPNTDNLVNINGPTYITNDNIYSSISVNFKITDYITNKNISNYTIACGSSNTFYTRDNGVTWETSENLTALETASLYIYDGYIHSNTKSLISSKTGGFVYYSNNRNNYIQIENIIPTQKYIGMHIFVDTDNIDRLLYAAENKLILFPFYWNTNPSSDDVTIISSVNDNINSSIMAGTVVFKGYNEYIYILKTQEIQKYEITTVDGDSANLNLINSSIIENVNNGISISERNMQMKVYDNNVVIFTDNTYVHGTTNGGLTWNNFQLLSLKLDLSANELSNIYIFDNTRAVIVGDNFFAYSVDGFINWRSVTKQMYNSTGLGYLLENKNFSSVYIPLIENIYLSDYNGSQTIIKKLFSPCLLDFQNTSTIETLGSIHARGDVLIHEGNLRSNKTTFDILPDTHDLINIGKNTSQMNIGNSLLIVDSSNSKVLISNTEIDSLTTTNASLQNINISGNLITDTGLIDSSSSDVNLFTTYNHDSINIGNDTTNNTVITGQNVRIGNSNGDIFLNGRVKGDLILEANVTIETATTQKGDFNVEGDASFNNDLHVYGNTIINDLCGNILTANKGIYSVIDSSNANITDISSIEILSSNITINNDLIVHQDASINNITSNSATIDVINATNITSTNVINGNDIIAQTGNFTSIETNNISTNQIDASNGLFDKIDVIQDSSFNSNLFVNNKITTTDVLCNSVETNSVVSNTVEGNIKTSSVISDASDVYLYSESNTGVKKYDSVSIGTNASVINLGGQGTIIVLPPDEDAVQATSEVAEMFLQSRLYFGLSASGENIPVIDTQTAYFNGNIIVTEDITFAGQGIIQQW